MNEELVKALTSLIDETIVEIEDLKKSRFSASEVKIKGPGEDGLKGHPADGKLDKEEDKDEKGEDDKDKDDKKDMDKGENNSADPNGGKHVAKADDEKKDKKDDKKKDDKDDDKDDKKDGMDKGENNSADPNGGHHVAKGEPKEGYEIKKSLEAHDALMKSYIDGRISTLEGKLGGILDLVKKIADQPVAPKGASAKNFQVLTKGANEVAPLSKSQVADKLFELKKSGKPVDSADITAAELGSTDLNSIITKYGLQ